VITAHTPPAAEVRILALGDSYTIGEGVPVDGRWPMQLARVLRTQGLNVSTPAIVARSGWTTDELSAGIDDARPTGMFDVVTLLIGVNNQYRSRAAEEYRTQFRALLARAIGFAGGRAGHVIVISIPDWGATPFARGRDRAAIARDIDAFNAVNRDESTRAGAKYVDVTAISRRAAVETDLIGDDKLHPSSSMYAAWVQAMMPTVLDAIR